MKWTDVQEIAIALAERHPGVDPKTLNFVTLHNYVVDLPGFADDHQRGGEKVLEAIQAVWIEETE